MTVTVTKGKGLWSIARENGVKLGDLYKANQGLESMQKKGTIPSGYKVKIPNKTKVSTAKPKIKSTSKEIVEKHTKKPKTKVAKESKNTKKCKCSSPSWMVVAKEEMNKKVQRNKYKGISNNNSTIHSYHQTTSIKGIDDYNRKKRGLNPRNSELISWCGTYINYVMKKSGYKTFSTAFRAKDWTKYGKKVSIPIYGAIGVMTRPKGGHVSFVMGVDNVKNPKYVYMLGGNQWGYSNNISWGTKTKKNGKSYIKSILYPSRYNLSDWNLGFYVPYSYCQINCKMKKYTGRYIISASDGN